MALMDIGSHLATLRTVAALRQENVDLWAAVRSAVAEQDHLAQRHAELAAYAAAVEAERDRALAAGPRACVCVPTRRPQGAVSVPTEHEPLSGRQRVVSVEVHEGTMLYSDETGKVDCRVFAHLSLSVVITPDGQTTTCWVAKGMEGSLAEVIAKFYMANPGMKDAVDGLLMREIKRRTGQL